MACLNKKQIIEASDIKMTKVPVPEWADGDPEAYVMVKSLTAVEQDEFDKQIMVEPEEEGGKPGTDLTNYRAKRAAFCMCDDAGNLLFTPEDIPALGGKNSKAMQRVLAADRELNGEGIETLRKNSSTTQDGSSHSD